MHLAIDHCGGCPLATMDRHRPACAAAVYLDKSPAGGRIRQFTHEDGGWSEQWEMFSYPSPPPGWCPLRADDVVIEIAPTRTAGGGDAGPATVAQGD
jgi:hypothetical protein